MTTAFSFGSGAQSQPTFGTAGTTTFGFGSAGSTSVGQPSAVSQPILGGSLFATSTQPTSTTTGFSGFGGQTGLNTMAAPGFAFAAPTNTSGGLTLGSAGTLFTSTALPSGTNSAPGLFSGFGAAAKSTFGLGLPTTSSVAPAIGAFTGFGGLGSSVVPTTTASTFGLGIGTGASSFGGFGSGLGLTTFTPATSTLGLGGPAVSTSTTSAVGLGGVDLTQAAISGGSSLHSKSDAKAVKVIAVPSEIINTIEAFKKYVKEQKGIREEISRVSSKPLFKVQSDMSSLKDLLSIVSNGIQRNVTVVEKLKLDTALELKNAEIAQRTKETPPALQYENTSPMEYFQQTVINFENRMQNYKLLIEQMEKHLLSLSCPTILAPQELALVMKRLHETLIALAAQLQTVHEAIKSQKEQYLNYRRVFYGETSNVFESRPSEVAKQDAALPKPLPVVTIGPTPFSGMSNATAAAMASALNRIQQPTGTDRLALHENKTH